MKREIQNKIRKSLNKKKISNTNMVGKIKIMRIRTTKNIKKNRKLRKNDARS